MTTNLIMAEVSTATLTVLTAVGMFLVITLLLVALLLIAKRYLVHSGKVNININGDTDISADSGKPLLSTLADCNVFLPSACGGKGSCGQCKVQVPEGAVTFFPQKPYTFHASRSRTIGVWPVR